MSLPPDEPTQPLPPVTPRPREPLRETTVVADDPAWRQMILDRLDNVRTGLVVVGLIALLASVLAAWALLRQEDDRSDRRSGASQSEVRDLRDRVDDLESDLRDAPNKGELSTLQRNDEELAKRVDDLAAKPAAGTDDGARESLDQLNETVSTLSDQVADLDRRVDALEQAP